MADGTLYTANLAFLLNYTDGTSPDEIEYELYKLAFQTRGSVHYDRTLGGEFENMEQENINNLQALTLSFAASMVESVYRMNEERGFSPYIVVGFDDVKSENQDGVIVVTMSYRLLEDLSVAGQIELEI